jgi:hypothetical protein
VAQIPDTGLHRDLEADKAVREAIAEVGGLREVLAASASLDVTPMSGGRFHVEGRVRARIGQTCVVTLDPIENEIDEPIDWIFAPPEQIPEMADLVVEAAESDVAIPEPPEPMKRHHRSRPDRDRCAVSAVDPIRANWMRCSSRRWLNPEDHRCRAQGAAARPKPPGRKTREGLKRHRQVLEQVSAHLAAPMRVGSSISAFRQADGHRSRNIA